MHTFLNNSHKKKQVCLIVISHQIRGRKYEDLLEKIITGSANEGSC